MVGGMFGSIFGRQEAHSVAQPETSGEQLRRENELHHIAAQKRYNQYLQSLQQTHNNVMKDVTPKMQCLSK